MHVADLRTLWRIKWPHEELQFRPEVAALSDKYSVWLVPFSLLSCSVLDTFVCCSLFEEMLYLFTSWPDISLSGQDVMHHPTSSWVDVLSFCGVCMLLFYMKEMIHQSADNNIFLLPCIGTIKVYIFEKIGCIVADNRGSNEWKTNSQMISPWCSHKLSLWN